jgi:hypothetical protein
MKKQLVLLAISCLCLSVHAQQQLPNGSFENWSQNEDLPYDEPDTWFGTSVNCMGTPFTCSASTLKVTDAHAGSYAAKLVNLANIGIGGSMKGQLIYTPDMPGYEVFTSKPKTFNGFYKFTNAGSDEITVSVTLIDADEQPVAYGETILTETKSAYTQFNLPIQYFSSSAVTGIYVEIAFNEDADAASTFIVDDLSFTYLSSPVTAKTPVSAGIQFYPNPGKDNLHFEKPVSNISISTTNGLNILNAAEETNVLNIASLQKGIYIISYEYNQTRINGKLVVEE